MDIIFLINFLNFNFPLFILFLIKKMEQLGVSICDFIEDVENVKRFDLAKTLCINRKKEIDVVNNKLNQDIKSYIDDEVLYIQSRINIIEKYKYKVKN